MSDYLTQTLAGIVTADHRAAAVFEKYQLDFCCKGKRSLEAACKEAQLDAAQVAAALDELGHTPNAPHLPDSLSDLVEYIIEHHHTYVKRELPLIMGYLDKVSQKHGERHPELRLIRQQFAAVKEELEMHLQKEELILFPRIKELEEQVKKGIRLPVQTAYLQAPINVMEHEHDDAGNGMAEIRRLTNNYTPPADACTTYRLSFDALEAFEKDLHRHVHLENNLLFPGAMELISHADA